MDQFPFKIHLCLEGKERQVRLCLLSIKEAVDCFVGLKFSSSFFSCQARRK